MAVNLYLDLVLLLLVVAAAVNDLATRRIPNRLLMAGWLCAFLLYLLAPAPGAAVLKALGGAGIGLLMFLPLYCLRGMAAGDVKLMATVGVFVGPYEVFQTGIMTWCIGGLMGLLIIIAKGRLRMAFANVRDLLRPVLLYILRLPVATVPPRQQSAGSMPYGVAIALATITLLVHRNS